MRVFTLGISELQYRAQLCSSFTNDKAKQSQLSGRFLSSRQAQGEERLSKDYHQAPHHQVFTCSRWARSHQQFPGLQFGRNIFVLDLVSPM